MSIKQNGTWDYYKYCWLIILQFIKMCTNFNSWLINSTGDQDAEKCKTAYNIPTPANCKLGKVVSFLWKSTEECI